MATNDYVYGSPYWIEEKNKDQWILKTSKSDMFTTEGYMLSKNSVNEKELNWAYRYGELTPGNYRVIKHFSYLTSSGIEEDFSVSVEFTINLGVF